MAKIDYNFFGRFRRLLKRIGNICWAAWNRHTMNHLIIHRGKLVNNPPSLILPLLCGSVKGKLRCPPELTILLTHNYDYLTKMELCLRYVGIDNYIVLRPQVKGPWRHTIKLEMIYNYLKSGTCKTDYILYCDSDDAILRDDPGKAIRYLEEENCDLLISSTKFTGRGYQYLPKAKEWADNIAKEQGYPGRYLNFGVFVGQKDFLLEVLEIALAYSQDYYNQAKHVPFDDFDGPSEWHSAFPEGCSIDQIILRYLYPRFYPRMKIDYTQRLALK
ncbi:MAG: hypothetical protein H6Q46_392 [Deltaproteobacteria bacterium]|nr:hypothetical protein [Deltaproteobacteria bacterium]